MIQLPTFQESTELVMEETSTDTSSRGLILNRKMVIIVLATLGCFFLAMWSTLFLVDVGQAEWFLQSEHFQTQFTFKVTPAVNSRYYAKLSQVGGKEGEYACFYQGGFASCQNEATIVELWFQSSGPVYILEEPTVVAEDTVLL